MAAPLALNRSRVMALARPSVSFALALALGLAALSLLPYLLAYLWTGSGRHFGGFFFIADDATTYLAKMRQGADGAWLWNDPYTSEPHGGVFLFSFYLVLGHLAALLHLPLIAAYHLARLAGAVVLVLAIDHLCRRMLAPELRKLALVIAVLGSGLGFVAQLAGNPAVLGQQLEALDLHLPELTGWYSILAIPHFVWATVLIVFALLGLLKLRDTPSPRGVLVTGALLLGLSSIHPQMVPVLALVWLLHRLVLIGWGQPVPWCSVLAEVAAFSISLPLLAYNAWILFNDPAVAQWAHQWRHQAPAPLSLAVSLGLPLLAASYGAWLAWRRRDRNLALLMVWLPLVLALLYLPNFASIQRRLLDAIYIPIGLLAALGLREALSRLSRARRMRWQKLLVPVSCASSALVLAIALRFASGAFSDAYLDDANWHALNWLSSHHTSGDRVLSSPGAGLYIPAWSGVSVYVGHYSETLVYFQKIKQVDATLQASVAAQQVQSFLGQNGITLLYWGPDEGRALTFQPESQPYLRLVYQAEGVAIYRYLPS
jgi:hypothetical protein